MDVGMEHPQKDGMERFFLYDPFTQIQKSVINGIMTVTTKVLMK